VHTVVAAWRRWQQAAGPWRGWAVCPALQLARSFAATPPPARTVVLEDLFSLNGTAVVADLEPLVGVALAAEASFRGLAHAVLVLPRWPHADAVLPVEPLTATLVSASRRLRQLNSSNVLFVLDGERRKSIAPRPRRDPRVDNRYDIAAADLPDLKTLRRAGIQRVVRISRSA
jgi:hypothetical protein